VSKEKERSNEVEGAVALPRILVMPLQRGNCTVVMPLQRVLAITHRRGGGRGRLRDRERRGREKDKDKEKDKGKDKDKEDSEERERRKQ